MSKQTVLTRKLAVNSPERKPSVFDRLGSKSCVVSGKSVCRNWMQNGTCPLNKACEFARSHVLFGPSKRSKIKTMKKSVIVQKKSKEEYKKSVKSHLSPEKEWEGWELGDLEDADEKVLEKRKQELQRELQLQLKKEKELARKKDKRIEKKRTASSSSSSSTTTESSSTSTTSSTTSSEPKKRFGRKRKHHSSSSDSEVSPHRRRKSPKSEKVKAGVVKKSVESKDNKVVSDSKSKSASVAKKSVQKKSYSPGWDKSKGRSPVKQQPPKKPSPHHSPVPKNKSPSPRYDKTGLKNKGRGFSPKQKEKGISPKRTMRKVKESNSHSKDKSRRSSSKARASPPRSHKVSPTRSRKHEESTDKRRSHYEDRQYSPRRDRSREKDRKRDVRRKRSHDDDNGGLKKGGKILPLKPASYNKDNGVKKDTAHHKSSEKNLDSKSKDDLDKDRNRADRDRERFEKDKPRCDKDRGKHKKSDEHERRSVRGERERDLDRNSNKSRDDRSRDREAERMRIAKEREAERQKIREEALERCRERQRERERLEKERKEKEEKKHQRDQSDNKPKDFEKDLPSLLDLKAENPRQTSDKHLQRDTRRNLDKDGDKNLNQGREGRDHGTPDKEHDRRDLRSIENDRRLGDKDYDRRNREGDMRGSSEVRRSGGDVRRGLDDGGDRRTWDEMRRVMDPVHGRRSMDPINDRRQHAIVRRPGDDHYRRGRDIDLDVRDFPMDERQRRKLMHNHPDWNLKDQNLDYRSADLRDDWNHPDRHPDWNSRYDHKWREHEDSRDGGWSHYSRRPAHDEWSNDWQKDQPRPLYPEERLDIVNEEFSDNNGKRPSGPDPPKEKELPGNASQEDLSTKVDKTEKEGDALSDISDDPDDILNQDDEPAEVAPPVTTATTASSNQNSASQQIYVRNDDFLFQQRRPLLDCLRERSLDFEEISDEELEEEARVGKGIVDVLGADWAGLVQETRPKPRRFERPGSAHRRWLMDRIISRFGISKKYATERFFDKVLNMCKGLSMKDVKEKKPSFIEPHSGGQNENEIKEEMENVEAKIEERCDENNADVYSPNAVKEEKEEKDEKDEFAQPEVEVNILHPVPALHSALREATNMKCSLFRLHNRFKRALSARTDLNLRRELCHLPSKEPLHFTPPIENKLYETSIQLFQCNASTAVV